MEIKNVVALAAGWSAVIGDDVSTHPDDDDNLVVPLAAVGYVEGNGWCPLVFTKDGTKLVTVAELCDATGAKIHSIVGPMPDLEEDVD